VITPPAPRLGIAATIGAAIAFTTGAQMVR